MKWLEQSNIFTSAWFSCGQSSFIPKFLVDFCDKIRKAHTVLARSNFLKKKFSVSPLAYVYYIVYIYIYYIVYIYYIYIIYIHICILLYIILCIYIKYQVLVPLKVQWKCVIGANKESQKRVISNFLTFFFMSFYFRFIYDVPWSYFKSVVKKNNWITFFIKLISVTTNVSRKSCGVIIYQPSDIYLL